MCALPRADKVLGTQGLTQRRRVVGRENRGHSELAEATLCSGCPSLLRTCVVLQALCEGLSTIAEPLTKLTRKNVRFEWFYEAQEAFDKLKKALQETTTLAFPHPDKPCVLDTDASDVAIGAVLSQVIDGTEHPIAFYSRIMSTTQHNYCPTHRAPGGHCRFAALPSLPNRQ